MTLRYALLLAAVFSGASAHAADWPAFRGPNFDGISKETGLLKEWPKSGLTQVWSTSGLGLGFGTPSVVNGMIYGVGNRDGKDGVWALKLEDGTEQWFTPCVDTKKVMRQNNGPASTPTFANGKLYAVTINGTVVCLNAADGKLLWKKSFVDDFSGSVPTWGYSGSVLVDGDKVICAPGGSKAGIVALKPADGEVIWKSELGQVGNGAGYSTPIKATFGGVPMYVVLMGDKSGIVGVSTETGKMLWQYKGQAATGSTAQIPIPIIKGDLVWVSCAYNGGAALIQIESKSKGEFEVKEIKKYKKAELNNHHGGMVLVGDYIYFGHNQNNGNPVCVEMKTGEIKWGPEKNPTGANGSAAVLYADGRLYFRYDNGMLVLIDPSPEKLNVISSFKLPAADQKSNPQSWPHPVIVNGKLLIRDQNMLYCYNVKAGK